jgi:nitrite reductase (NADH) small subunit
MSIWYKIIKKEDIPSMGSRVVVLGDLEIALFKTKDGSIFAINNICPHKEGKLSDGLVHENIVTCPLHNWDVDLSNGEALGGDSGCTNVYKNKIENNYIYVNI